MKIFSSQKVNIFTLLYFLIKNSYFFIGIIKTVKRKVIKMKKENIALEIRKELLNKEILRNELMQILESKDISWSCFKKYVEVERIFKEKLIEYSLQELVDELNSFSDCGEVYCSFEYRVIDNKAYEVIQQEYIKIL